MENAAQTDQKSFKWHPALWLAGLGILCIPALAMLVTEQVQWSIGDFMVFGAMLSALFLIMEVVISRKLKMPLKTILIGLSVIAFVTIWAELAVGIFS